MKTDDRAAYYLMRAKQEEEAARKATTVQVASIHLDLADRYWVMASGVDSDANGDVSKARG